MCSWGKAISTFFGRSFGVLFREFPILGNLFEIGAGMLSVFCGPLAPVCAVAAAAASTTFVAGVTSGSLAVALKAGLIAGVTAIANFGVGSLTQGLGALGNVLNVAGHALVGCGSSVASGGSCQSGALAGGASTTATLFTAGQFPDPWHNPGDLFAGTAISATVGGFASVAGGGKFANGAVTGAFGYLFSPQAGDKGEGAYAWADWDSASHQYGYRDYICDTSQVGCTVANAFQGLLRNAYPGQPEGTIVQPDKTYYVTGGNPIHVEINYDQLYIINVTDPGHMFYNGTVTRWVEQEGNQIYLGTFGSGTNSWVGNATENWLAGELGFNASTAGIQLYIYSLGRSAAANSHIFWPRP
jgi:hypothetical protein